MGSKLKIGSVVEYTNHESETATGRVVSIQNEESKLRSIRVCGLVDPCGTEDLVGWSEWVKPDQITKVHPFILKEVRDGK
jgi:hypothetical protein